ncbi:MAG TPA: FAD-dependent oxidoreductase [Fimbriimonas sp.]|nr:FAD-dependent oxidoreductase [Fimbriimonas sp.]
MALAFPTLTSAQIEALRPYGKEERFAKEEVVWAPGVANLCMYVVVSGEMKILDGQSHKYVASHYPGSFSGDIDVISGRASLVTGIAATDLETLTVPADCVRSIVGERPEIGEIILRAFLTRRTLLQEMAGVGVLVIGSRYCACTLRIREFLARNRYPVAWQDLESDLATNRTLQEFQVTEDEVPVVILPSGDMLKSPTDAELAKALGLTRPIEAKLYDLVIVGAGPAGLAAAVYGASEGLSTLCVDSSGPGGQAGTSSRIENYMGFPLGLSGQDLADRAVAQAEKFGAQMFVPSRVSTLTCNKLGGHDMTIEGLGEITAKCVILAPGASYRRLEVDDLEKYENRGVYYAATNVERILCEESAVAVVGAGNSAGQAAVFMSQNSACVYLVVRGDDLRKSMSSYLARRIETSDKIRVLLNSEVCALHGDDYLEACTIADRKSGKKLKENISGIFVMVGAVPHTDWLPETICRDEKGFILTGDQLVQEGRWSQPRTPFFLETSCPGVFAVGDARSGSVKRVASAVGEGSMAVAFIHQFLAL